MVGSEQLGTVPWPQGLPADRRVTVGLRPERIVMGPAREGTPAQIDLLEPMGLGTVIHLNLAGQILKIFTTDRLQGHGRGNVGLCVASADILLFDPRSGLRLRAG
jgi:multiple sugar transport system ATP-binding protein